nr:MAG TPA: Protein of unknown function (DUF669) [Caudoviricetes sp.]
MAVDLLDLGDFTGNEDEGTGFSPIDSGRYRATVFDISREVGKNSGKPYLKWCFQICEGEPFAGRRLWDNTSLSDNAKWRLVQVLKACGIDVPKGHLQLNPNDLLGKELIIMVGLEPDEYANDRDGTDDQMRNVIKSFAPTNGVSKPKIQVPDAPKPASKPAPKKSAKKAPKAPKNEEEVEYELPFDETPTPAPAPAPAPKEEPLPVTDVADDDDDDFDFE